LIHETKEVQVEDEGSRVFGSGNWARGYKDGEGEDERCFGLADTEVCQGCLEVLGIGELLLLIYSELCIHIKTMTKKQEEAFRELKEKFTKKSVLAVLNLDKKMSMEVDALDYAIGGVLSMKFKDSR